MAKATPLVYYVLGLITADWFGSYLGVAGEKKRDSRTKPVLMRIIIRTETPKTDVWSVHKYPVHLNNFLFCIKSKCSACTGDNYSLYALKSFNVLFNQALVLLSNGSD